MGRLIDADKPIELMIRDRDYAEENGFMDMFYERQHLIGVINKQPTAYDVDKVVEQLEDYANEEMHYYKGTPYEKCIEVCIGEAIEIVKGGGVKNDQ